MGIATTTTRTTRTECALSGSGESGEDKRTRLMFPQSFSLQEVWQAYYDCRRRKRRTPNALLFEKNLEFNLLQLCYELNSGIYTPGSSTVFTISYPKPREVWAALFKDRIVHHLLINRLAQYYEPRFITDTYACIKGRGTLSASQKLEKYLRKASNNWDKSIKKFIIKIDISNFFVSISRRKLWNIIYSDIAEQCRDGLWSKYIKQSIFYEPTANPLVRCNADFSIIPPHKSLYNAKSEHGLPIGNLTSQFYANVYLNQLDQYCKHQLKLKGYVRYVDDIVFITDTYQEGKNFINIIDEFIFQKLELRLSPAKCHITPIQNGVTFVGRTIKPFHTTHRKLTMDAAYNTAKLLAAHPNSYSICSLNSYLGLFIHAKTYKFRKFLCELVCKLQKILCDFINYCKIFRLLALP